MLTPGSAPYNPVWLLVVKLLYVKILVFLLFVSIFRQGRLQFRPPFEEVRARYYREMKRFISIPNQFRGVSEAEDESIFTVMTERNANGFLTAFSKAEDLFRRLTEVSNQFKVFSIMHRLMPFFP